MSIPNAVWSSIKSDLHAVAVLTHNGCDIHALSLMYSSIDKMAWISSTNIDHGRKEFMAWVDSYFLPGFATPLAAVDIYAARCGFLHAGTAESKLYRDSKAKLIINPTGPRRPQAEVEAEVNLTLPKLGLTPSDVVVVQCIDFSEQWVVSMQRFTDAIEADANLQALTKERAELQLAIFPAG
ncbi:hypothetical protein [Pseudomonas putida]|uniref:hypothetical protein n=1 Tax=Pseudomonas putida TaxID=303 RepID=UPI000750DAB2|nr:hypothetical protein [Pseudomonas putida]